MNDQDLRDCFAMFAMMGFVNNGAKLDRDVNDEKIAGWSYKMADEMLKARNAEPEEEKGITAVRKKRVKGL
tara:strand:- start:1873 stop:2085 length:213 start_codon:yes stop_codon:yes gene_type:complete